MTNNTMPHDLDDFLCAILDDAHPAILESVNPSTAQRILDALPSDSRIRESLRDAFRDNIPTDIVLH